MNANYVFAHNLTSLTDIAEPIANLTFNRGYDWGNSSIGFKHKVTGRINYELPFGKGATGLKKTAIAGWQVNAIAFWQSGEPYTVTDNQNLINLPNLSVDRPNQIPGQSCQAANPSIRNWINLNAFRQQPIGFAGDEGRAMPRPHWRSLDFSIFRTSQSGKFKLSFRAEGLQYHEHPNFSCRSPPFQWTVSRDPTGVLCDQRGVIRPDHIHQSRLYAPRDAVGAAVSF